MADRADRIPESQRERRYEVEGIRLSYLSSRVFGALAGIEPNADLKALLSRPHSAYALRTLIKHGLIDECDRLTKLGKRFASRVYLPTLLDPPAEDRPCNFGDLRLPERFWSKAIPEPNTGCWLWLGAQHKLGYGHFAANGKDRRAHRIAFMRLRRAIPDELEIDHKCRTPSCCNPWHLEPVTHAQNVERGWKHRTKRSQHDALGRFTRGTK